MDDTREVTIRFRYESEEQSARRAADTTRQLADSEKKTNALQDAAAQKRMSLNERFSKAALDNERRQKAAIEARAKAEDDAYRARQANLSKYMAMMERSEKIMFLGGMMGLGVAATSGPLAIAAKAYVQQAGMAEAVSRKWSYAMQDINNSTYRIGRIAAQEIEPFLEKAAVLADKIADLIERNPGLVKASLAIGGTLTAGMAITSAIGTAMRVVGALGVLGMVGSGTGAASGAVGGLSARLAMAAAGQTSTGAIVAGTTGGVLTTIAGILTKALPFLAAIASYAIVRKGYQIAGEIPQEKRGLATGGAMLLGTLAPPLMGIMALLSSGGALRTTVDAAAKASPKLKELAETWGLLAKNADKVNDAQNNTQFETGRKMYQGWRKQEIEAERAYGEQRSALVAQEGEQRKNIEANYEKQRTSLVESFAKQQTKAVQSFERQAAQAAENLAKSLRQMEVSFSESQAAAASAFAQGEAEAEAGYYEQRSELAKQFGEEAVEAEKAHQKEMQRMREDAQIEIEGAVASRDALALVAAYRNYERNRKRAEEDYQDDRKARSAAYAEQIKDLESSFAEERARRLAAYQEQQAEARADYEQRRSDALAAYQEQRAEAESQFAEMQAEQQAAYQEQLDELSRAKADELNKLAEANRDALSELDRRYAQERQLRQQAFTDSIMELDANLLNERTIREQYYAQMTADYTAWLQNMAAQIATQGNSSGESGSRQTGGYVYGGLWKLHQGEYVMNPDITRAAESIAGGKLSNENLMSVLLGSARNTLTYNDQRRISGQVSASDRANLRRDTIRTVREMMEYATR